MRLLALWVLVAACGESKRDVAPQPTAPTPVATATPPAPGDADVVIDAPKPELEFPEDVAPPPPFDRLRPRMKQADVLATLGEQSVRPASTVASYFSFDDGRLASIRIQSYDDRVLAAVRDRWGKPSTVEAPSGEARTLGMEGTIDDEASTARGSTPKDAGASRPRA